MAKALAAVIVGLPAALALGAGAGAVAAVVCVVAVLVALDLHALLAAAGMRSVLPVALAAAVAGPLVVLADPAGGWGRLPILYAGAVALSFLFVLVLGRRRGVVGGLAATGVIAVLVGVGGAGLVLLRDLPDGWWWLTGLALLTLAADLGPLAARPVAARIDRRRGVAVSPPGFGATFVVVVLVAGALALSGAEPFGLAAVAGLALVALVAATGGDNLQRALSAAAGSDPRPVLPAPGTGAVLAVADAMFLAAPVAYAYALSLGATQ